MASSSSRRTLSVDPLELPLDRSGDAPRDRQAPEHPPHKAGRYALLAGNLAEIRPSPDLLPELDDIRGILSEGQIGTSATELHYAERDKRVKENIPSRVRFQKNADTAKAVYELRDSLGYKQQQFADAVGVGQTRVAKWESGQLRPPGPICAVIAKLAPDGDRSFWLRLAGLSSALSETNGSGPTRLIPLLRDAAAAGTPRAIDESQIEEKVSFPRHWLPPGGSIYAIKVSGDSMSPTLEDGDIALVDVASRNPEKLVDKMIAAREMDGVTLKWLRKEERVYLLVPQHTSPRHPVHVWTKSNAGAIVGEVVGWFGRPPTAYGKRK